MPVYKLPKCEVCDDMLGDFPPMKIVLIENYINKKKGVVSYES